MNPAEHADVAIVGARCGGSPLAALLARRGLKVVVFDQVTLPRPTLSSHVKQADSLAFLDRLGVIDRVRATGAPFTRQVDARLDDFRIVADIPHRPGDVGGGACIRRVVLDPILADAAAEAGADMRMATKVTGLIEERGRVAGLRYQHDGGERRLRARLVVGADGRSSTVAKLVGARRYNVVPNERAYYWSYFEGADLSIPPRFVFHRWGDRFIIANPSDNGLYMVGCSPERTEREEFKRNLEPMFMDHALSCDSTAEAIEGARRATKIYGILRFDGYFREASGPGWALVGDAGHFKDPAAGRGIGDAFLQVDRLAPALVEGLGAGEAALDRALRRWVRWRDLEFNEHYWMGVDFGAAGQLPLAAPEIFRKICAQGHADRFVELLSHRTRPSQLITIPRMLGAGARTIGRRGVDRRTVVREGSVRLVDEVRRRWMARRPVHEPPEADRRAKPAQQASAAPPVAVGG